MLTAVLDDPYSSTSAEMDIDYFMASSSIPGADLSWLETDPDISDPELDQEMEVPEAGASLLEQDSDSDFDPPEIHPCLESPSKGHSGPSLLGQDSDSDSDVDPSEIHPCLEFPSKGHPNISEPGSLHRDPDSADPEDTNENLPDIVPDLVAKLQK
jgi:hypothetical protein